MNMHFYYYVIGGNAYPLDRGKEWWHSVTHARNAMTSIFKMGTYSNMDAIYMRVILVRLTFIWSLSILFLQPTLLFPLFCYNEAMHNFYISKSTLFDMDCMEQLKSVRQILFKEQNTLLRALLACTRAVGPRAFGHPRASQQSLKQSVLLLF